MALGHITKQLAAQALGNTIDNVMDKTAPASAADNIGATIIGEIQAMQKALKEDQELVVLLSVGEHAGQQRLRVLEIYLPSWQVAVLTGVDPEKSVTRVISPIAALQLDCKVMRVQPSVKPTRITVIAPKTGS